MTADTAPIVRQQRLFAPLPAETVQEIREEVAKVKVSHLFLSVVGGVFVGLGWLAWMPFKISRACVRYGFVCARRGWRQAQGLPLNEPSISEVLAENAMLRLELERLQ